ncbi:MAG: PAS domain S-box protein [Halobacteriota archaeon]
MRAKKKVIGRGILIKLVGAMMFLPIISVAILLSVALHGQKQQMESNLIEENKRLAEVAARSIEAGYIAHLFPFRMLNQINASEDVLFWWIINHEGEIYLADNPAMCGERISGISISFEAGKPVVKDCVYGSEDIKFIFQPLNIGESGNMEGLCMGISLKPVREALNKMVITSVGYLLMTVAFACLLSFSLARRFTGHITQLVDGTKAISRGEFGHRVAIKTGDELEELGDSFNKMAQRVKSALEKEKVARKETEKIMNTMITTLIVVGPDGRIVKANKAAFNLLGYSEAELIGMPFDKIVGTPKETEVGFETTHIIIAKNARAIPVNCSASVMRDEEGKLQCIVCDAEDITEQKKAEEELMESMNKLERFNHMAVGRELRMIELKSEVNRLYERLGDKPPYDISFVETKQVITNWNVDKDREKRGEEKEWMT